MQFVSHWIVIVRFWAGNQINFDEVAVAPRKFLPTKTPSYTLHLFHLVRFTSTIRQLNPLSVVTWLFCPRTLLARTYAFETYFDGRLNCQHIVGEM